MPIRPQTFRPLGRQTTKALDAARDRRRGSARERGYDARWDKASKLFLLHHPLCLGCEAVGRTEAAVLVDHVEPHKGDMDRFWDQSMWQPSCRWHHDVVKQRLEHAFANDRTIKLADLWLDSAAATALTLHLDPGLGG